MPSTVKIFDTTLRDGNQAKGISLSLQDKLHLARLLDDFGIDYIEGGWPNATNPIDIAFFEECHNIKWKHAKISAFGSTRRPDTTAAKDKVLSFLVKAKSPVITIFGKSWDIHVTKVLRTSLKKNLEMIEDSVSFLKKHTEEVIYDAEHFFDGYKANPEYAIKTLEAAAKGGADCVVLCDTNGGMGLPWEIEDITKEIVNKLSCPIGIHAHNDSGTAIANSLAAVKGGAVHAQGTINGYGERCGNTSLSVLIPSLQLKMGKQVSTPTRLKLLRKLSINVSEIVNSAEDIRQPFVGSAAFAHKGGAHIDGVRKVSYSFEHIDPTLVGNARDFIVSNQSGAGLVLEKIKKIKPDADKRDPKVQEILANIKELESQGFHFEIGEGSFHLMVRRTLGMVKEKFKVLSYRVIEENRKHITTYSEATVKIKVKDEFIHMAAEGSGPVDAMSQAARLALQPFFPSLKQVRLVDYKVRVLDDNGGTGSTVRVWIRFHDQTKGKEATWNTIGVSENIIKASWMALMDGFNYKLLIHK
ncbi:MAG: citramalate synthase [Fibrobacteria bacterium]|nr:citramalate synthase [Fibrobacteria bacterium]